MKCTEAEKWILLQDSAEDSGKHGGALAAHLHDCKSCQRFQHALSLSHDSVLATEDPSETVLNNVKREARRQAPEPKKALLFYWKPALAAAASVMIALGLFFSTVSPDRVGLELVMTDTELLDMKDQAISVMYAGLSEDDLAFNFLMTYEGG